MDRIEIDNASLGLTEAFNNWLSTVVDTVNAAMDDIEVKFLAIDPAHPINLTRADTSAPANAEISDSFKELIRNLIERIDALEERIEGKS